MHNELDRLAENAFAREQGFEEGEAKGKAEGIEETNLKTAKAMLARKYPIDEISGITGLSEEEIQKLATSFQATAGEH